ncbi:DUF1302 family protein [Zoogloea ramigera]|nr:DUF1302 family protein [Zoogloea ramigera]
MTHIFRHTAVACSMMLCVAAAQAADDELELEEATEATPKTSGILQFDVARTYARPEHWSMARARAELTAQGGSQGLKWKISGRADADAVFAIDSGFYPDAVRRDQQYQFDLRETYLDFSAGDVDIRLGRQHIVWGEMVGLFFADVVSARDLRSFYLPEFEQLRIPQWAARAEYYFGDTHAELVWIPVPSYDRIGKPGAEFYPMQLPQGTRMRGEVKPDNTLANSNWGARLSRQFGGWDMSGFYYRSLDVAQTFYQVGSFGNEFEPRHDRITQIGGTMAKDFGEFVLKGELVHARGRKYNTFNPALNPDGLVAQNTMDYAFGVDIPAFRDGRVNLQYFGRRTFDLNPAIGLERVEDGASILLNTKLAKAWEGEMLFVSMLKRTDFMFRPRVIWSASKSWRLVFGADVFGGDATGAFGRYSDRDRVYTEARWSF